MRALHLTFIALAMFLQASMAKLLIEAAIEPAPTAELSALLSRKPRRAEQVTALNSASLAKMLGLRTPESPAQETHSEPTDPGPVKSGLRLRLLGTLLGASEPWTLASMQNLASLDQGDYRVGDQVLGAEIIDIERTRVIILNHGRHEYIATDPTPAVSLPSPNPAQAEIKVMGENAYEIPRREIDRTLADITQLLSAGRSMPAFKDGQMQGFRFFSIRPDSILSKIGVTNGDVIKRVNGFELNSADKVLEIYSRLKEADRIDIELERNGTSIRKQYTIR